MLQGREIAKMTGHKNLQSLDRYINEMPTERRAELGGILFAKSCGMFTKKF